MVTPNQEIIIIIFFFFATVKNHARGVSTPQFENQCSCRDVLPGQIWDTSYADRSSIPHHFLEKFLGSWEGR